MLMPGDVNGAGGIGRWADYMRRSWTDQQLAPPLEIVDTRGRGHAGHGAMAFARALLHIVVLYSRGQLAGLHANLSKRGSTARKLIVSWLAAGLGIPITIHLHGSGFDAFFAGLPRFWQRRVSNMLCRADRVLVLGRHWADWATTTAKVPAERVQILYNGVPEPPRRNRLPGPTRILFLGRLGERKGVPELVAALASPPLRARGWTAVMAGDGEVAHYRGKIDAAGLADRIAVPGWLTPDATSDLLAQSDILVLPSHAENSPISIMEALAAGVAVIATPVGTTPELLHHERSALLVPVGDTEALADALGRLIDDPALRGRIASAGHDVWAEKLQISVLARRLAALHDMPARSGGC